MRHFAIRPTRNDFMGDFENFFNGFFDTPTDHFGPEKGFNPSVDVRETQDDLYLTFELPGMNKDEIKIGVESGVLTVAGERKSHCGEGNDNIVRSEIRLGGFRRSFTLPKRVDLKNISADYKNGLLEIRLGKVEESKPKEIEVKVS